MIFHVRAFKLLRRIGIAEYEEKIKLEDACEIGKIFCEIVVCEVTKSDAKCSTYLEIHVTKYKSAK